MLDEALGDDRRHHLASRLRPLWRSAKASASERSSELAEVLGNRRERRSLLNAGGLR